MYGVASVSVHLCCVLLRPAVVNIWGKLTVINPTLCRIPKLRDAALGRICFEIWRKEKRGRPPNISHERDVRVRW
jgi:hypothetical protein